MEESHDRTAKGEAGMWKIEKLDNPVNKKGYDFCIQIRGWWVFSLMLDSRDGYSSLIIFNRILWDSK